ncbi:MAG: TraX family protein [Lachnospiraceae bacterium]
MKTLNRTQLKIIAICAMVCDHIAWGFLDFMTPLAQIMHIIGRFTVPIMCYFVAEGFRHTRSVKQYIYRMMTFWIISIIPFYLFFHELYDYRQNIIFDLLLGLIVLAVLENKKFKVWQKVPLVTAVFLVSAFIGGWVIMPILFILVFYYVKDFKKQALWVCGLTVTLVLVLAGAIALNNIWHFSHYEWIWYEKLYFLGFMLPLIVLKRYNGERGKEPIGRYFFYIFYPAHFLVLAGIKTLINGCSAYEIYVGLHFLALIMCVGILIIVLFAKPSRGQIGTMLLVITACIYTFGFIVEITSKELAGFYSGTLMEYLGECLLIFGFTLFVREMCHRVVPAFVFAAETVLGLTFMWLVFTAPKNHIFYSNIGVDTTGPFPRLDLSYGWGFYIFIVYMMIVCIWCFITCIRSIRRTVGAERKRILCTAIAICCPWLSNIIRSTGITKGYEIPCFGILLAVVLVGTALIKYGYFDSISLAGENALNHGNEGIMVITTNNKITYFNKRMEQVFGPLSLNTDISKNKMLKDIFAGNIKSLSMDDRYYEMRVEPLKESGYIQGYMLWMLDITEHHNTLIKINDMANKDSLTGINNRSHFKQLVEEFLQNNTDGALFMMDLDDFKQINDRFGHQQGDVVLTKFANVISNLGDNIIPCRIGGDEFCLFGKNMIHTDELQRIAVMIADNFKKCMSEEKYHDIATVSIGIAVTKDNSGKTFEKLYSNADKALYVAKNRNKNTYYIL